MPWLRLEVEADAADEELVAVLLAEATGASGTEIVDERAAELDASAAALPRGRVLVRAYVPHDVAQVPTLDLSELPTAVQRETTYVSDDWQHTWKAFFRPARVSDRVVVRPPWEHFDDLMPGDVELIIEPGMAFGTGTHHTTKLCLRTLDALYRESGRRGGTVLDVGCGTGILSIAAIKLGASQAKGLDIEEPAVRVSNENAAVNGVAARFEVSLTPLRAVPGTFDVVIANILSSILVDLRAPLLAHVAPGGVLLLSGILTDEVRWVAEQFRSAGAPEAVTDTDGDWASLRFDLA